MLTPVPRQSLSDAVFTQLKQSIVRGELPAGEALPAERALCTALGVNRGALREALKRLEQAGLVRIQHGGGTRVADFVSTAGLELLPDLLFGPNGQVNTSVARGVMEMRSTLAVDIARRAATRRSPQHLQALSLCVKQMALSQDDLPGLQRLAMEFWGQAVQATDNLAYRLAYNSLERTYTPIFDVLTQALSQELLDLGAYEAIVEAIAGQAAERAAQLAKDLTMKGEAGLQQVLAALDALQPPPQPEDPHEP